jgi:hypothetical protein
MSRYYKNKGFAALLALATMGAACGGAEKAAEETKKAGVEGPAPDAVVAACEESAKLARDAIAAEAAAPDAASAADGKVRWETLATLLVSWRADAHPCAAPGPKVSMRAQTRDDVVGELEQAADASAARSVAALKGAELSGALSLLAARYATGEAASPALKEAASGATQANEIRLFELFEANKAWAKTGEAASAVSCVFGRAAIDPKTPPSKDIFTLFEGKTDVHVLCLIPLPADKWAGDPAGQVVMELSANGAKSAAVMELGPPEKWANTRYFRGRFGLPQGVGNASTAAYSVSLFMRRPKLGDESLSTGSFFWHK